jgi:hypothetical protein
VRGREVMGGEVKRGEERRAGEGRGNFSLSGGSHSWSSSGSTLPALARCLASSFVVLVAFLPLLALGSASAATSGLASAQWLIIAQVAGSHDCPSHHAKIQ